MKFKNILITFLFLLVLTTAVSAERYINYEFKEGIISESGKLTKTNNQVDNVGILGFTCLNNGCSLVGEKIWDLNSGTNDSIQLTYPTTRPKYGYAIYYYKEDYITWEQNAYWFGTDYTDPQGPYTKYLSKKQNCHAPIDSFSIINTARPNIPLVIEVEAKLDAETYAAIHSAGPLDYVPSELQNYYEVDTTIILTIYNENDQIMEKQIKDISIPFSGSKQLEFYWTPTIEGRYKATVTTDVTDKKCSSSIPESSSKQFTVLEEEPKDSCYTILNDLETSDKFPDINELLTITYTKISNFVNNDYDLIAVPMHATYEVRQGKSDETGSLEYSNTIIIPATSTETPSTQYFNWIPTQPGWYTIYITGRCHHQYCNTRDNLEETISEEIYAGVSGNHAPLITSTPITQAKINEEYFYDVDATDPDGDILTYTLKGPSNMEINSTTGVITWTPEHTGDYKITVQAEDNSNNFNQQTFIITVTRDHDKKHLITMASINLIDTTLSPGNTLNGFLQLRNIGQKKEKNIKITAYVPKLGIKKILTTRLYLGPHDSKWVPITLEIPYDASTGDYLLKVEVENKYYETIGHNSFKILNIEDKYILNA